MVRAVDTDNFSSHCPDCGSKNWHNVWLCRECGYPDRKIWIEYLEGGYIKPRTNAGKERARVARFGKTGARIRKR